MSVHGRGDGVVKVVLKESWIGGASALFPQPLPGLPPLGAVMGRLSTLPLLREVAPLLDPRQLLGVVSHRVLLAHGRLEMFSVASLPLPHLPLSSSLLVVPSLLLTSSLLTAPSLVTAMSFFTSSSLFTVSRLLLPPHGLLVSPFPRPVLPHSRTPVTGNGRDGLRA